MDIQYFLKVLWRRRWLLLFVTLTASILTYLLVGLRPATFKSNAIISTGITIEKGIKLDSNDPFVQKFQITNQFDNLMATMLSRNSIKLLSYQLLLHDLMADSINRFPFRAPINLEELEGVSEDEIRNFVSILYLNQDSLRTAPLSQSDDALFHRITKAYEYDFENITENMELRRIGETDYIRVEFESESPNLSEYIVNSFCYEFIRFNSEVLNRGEDDEVSFYRKLAVEKKQKLDELNDQINLYRQQRNIIDLQKQSEAIVTQISDLELKREDDNKEIAAHRRNIANLNRYIDKFIYDSGESYTESSSLKHDLTTLKSEIKEMSSKGTDLSDYERQQLALKRQKLDQLIKRLVSAKKRDSRDFDEKGEELFNRRVEEEIELSKNEEGVRSIDREIQRLRNRSNSLVSAESFIENLEGEKKIVLEEYLQAVEKLNNAKVIQLGSESPLTIFEHAQVPEEPEPSNRALLSGFAGVATFSLSTFLIFLLSFFDTSLSSPTQFERFVQLPLLGSINRLRSRKLDLEQVFADNTRNNVLENYKESLRKIRNNIEASGAKNFLFTSTKTQEGKTFSLVSLAYSLSQKNKKVLILDTNFKHNSLTQFSNKELADNPLQNGHVSDKSNGFVRKDGRVGNWLKIGNKDEMKLLVNGKIDIVGNKLSSHSPSEILAGHNFEELLESFGEKYDYIFMEAASLNDYSDTQELVKYADKVIIVFDSKTTLNRSDKDSLEYLKGLGDKFMGAILNQIDPKNVN